MGSDSGCLLGAVLGAVPVRFTAASANESLKNVVDKVSAATVAATVATKESILTSSL
jgi:hydroxyethylthiazole kinase-like sugar kinase family protein